MPLRRDGALPTTHATYLTHLLPTYHHPTPPFTHHTHACRHLRRTPHYRFCSRALLCLPYVHALPPSITRIAHLCFTTCQHLPLPHRYTTTRCVRAYAAAPHARAAPFPLPTSTCVVACLLINTSRAAATGGHRQTYVPANCGLLPLHAHALYMPAHLSHCRLALSTAYTTLEEYRQRCGALALPRNLLVRVAVGEATA